MVILPSDERTNWLFR